MSLLIAAALATAMPHAPQDKLQTFDYDQVVRCALVYSLLADEALDRNDEAWADKVNSVVTMAMAMAKGVGKARKMTEAQVDADLNGAFAKYKDQYPNLGSKVAESGRCDRALGLDSRKPRPAGG